MRGEIGAFSLAVTRQGRSFTGSPWYRLRGRILVEVKGNAPS